MTRYAPRTMSGCCRARVVAQRCSECLKPAPWRTRLTEAEAERVTARLTRPVVAVSPGELARARAALYPLENDN